MGPLGRSRSSGDNHNERINEPLPDTACMSWLDTPLVDKITPISILAFLLLLIGAVLIARLGNMVIRDYLDERMGKRLSKGVARVFQYMVLMTAALIGFNSILALDLSAIVLSLGVAGIAVAFASQQIIQNAISGVLIAIIKPIQLEDWVEVGPIPLTGISRVKDITLMNTVLREVDGRIITVPNSQIMNGKIINYTQTGFTAVNIPLWVGNINDLERIQQIVFEEADKDPYILPDVDGEEKGALARLFEKRSMRLLFGNENTLRALDPQVNIAEIQGTRARMMIKIWLREPSRREEIASRFLYEVGKRLAQENIELRDP